SAQPLVLGRPAYPVPVPAECGGVPDPFALLETVRRVRAEGGTPRVLVLSPADDPTGTTAPPELLHEVCEAAAGEGLLIISDETDRDALHPSPVAVPDTPDAPPPPGDPAPAGRGRPVFGSPAEMLPGHVVVLAGLGTTLLPPGW
ncbi:hypothetical protein GTY57_21560, partial [Streptomyces sp. SID5475]|nr:hypothetical protein [Streptomyces sp. SID5475]